MSTIREELLPGKVLALKKVLSTDECKKYIEMCEKKGFKQATINVGQQTVQKEEIRNNDTVIIYDKELAVLLWERVKEELHTEFSTTEDDDTQALALSDHFRFYRYEKGQRFVRHYDGYEYGSMVYTTTQNKPQPKLTFLVYLNSDFEGGKTTFFNSKGKEILGVSPEPGMGLVYTQKLLHEGSVVAQGRKYVLRTDILFAKPPPPQPQEQGWSCIVQ